MASQIFVQKKRVQYSSEHMANAIEAVRNGMAKNRASKLYSVPKTTLLDKLANRVPEQPTKPGPKSVLTKAEESTLVNYTNLMADIGYPITRKELCFEVKRLMDLDGRRTPFKDNLPGYDWYTAFMKRHPDLTERIPQSLGHERAAISMPMVEAWYNGLFSFLKKEIPNWEQVVNNPRRVFNADESGFPLCMKSGKVLSQTGAKHVYQVVAHTKQQITVMACFNALGDYVSPLIVYPGQRFRDTGITEFPEAIYAHSENGWMDRDLFISFLEVFNTFVEEKKIEKPVILFVDGHSTHMTAEAARFCAENKVILYCLLPNATHVMQACDVGFFSPMKSAWRGNVKRWQMEHLGKAFTKHDFPKVFKLAWETCTTISIAAQAFKRSGLFPLTSEGIDTTKLGPCKIASKKKVEDESDIAKGKKTDGNGDDDGGGDDEIIAAVGIENTVEPCEDGDKEISIESQKDGNKENVQHVVVADVHISAEVADTVGEMWHGPRDENAVSKAFETLGIPEINTGKGKKSNRKKLPKALSGHDALKMFKEREEEKIEEERKKKERAEMRLKSKQKKEEEQAAKKQRAEERKRLRDERELNKRVLKRKMACKKLFDDADSDEDFEEEFESDSDSETLFCPGCQSTGGKPSEWVYV